jgi:hypothetical protein
MRPDESTSLALGIGGAILSLALPRKYAIVPLAVSMFIYPSVMLMPPPQLSFTPQRFIGLVLMFRCILSSSIRSSFKWRLIDTAALIYYLLVTVSMCLTVEFGPALNNRLGFFLSAMVPFWCARFLITDREALYAFLKGSLWTLLPLAIFGWLEMLTSWNPWDKMRQYGIIIVPRMGDGWREFWGARRPRARGPFLQYIMWGWLFGLFIAFSMNLYYQRRKLLPWIVPFLFLPLGMISSIASGPMMLGVAAFALMLCFPFRQYWKPAAITALVLYIAGTGYSNRGPMEIIADFGMDPISSWYRVGLVRHTLHEGGMAGHWLLGFGHVPPEYAYHDLCIHWIWLLVVHGVAGWIGFYGLLAALGWTIWKARLQANSVEDQYLLWSFMSTILASLAAMLVVALFGETYYIYHMLLGLMANAPLLVGSGAGADRQVGVLAMLNGNQVLLRYRLKPGQRLALVTPVNQQAPQPQELNTGVK